MGAGTPGVSEKLLQEHTALLAKELDASNAGLAGRCALALSHAGLRKPLALPEPAESKVRAARVGLDVLYSKLGPMSCLVPRHAWVWFHLIFP